MSKSDFFGVPQVIITVPDITLLNTSTDIYGTLEIRNGYGSTYPAGNLYNSYASFKIAGNSTATAPKKPIGITTLTGATSGNNPVPLLGMQPHHKWRLLAGAYDLTGDLRNHFAYTLGNKLPMPWAVDTRQVEMYYKISGVETYQGTFMMCETVKQGTWRVPVSGTGAFICEQVIDVQIDPADLASCFTTPLLNTGGASEYLNAVHGTEPHSLLLDYKGTGESVTTVGNYVRTWEADLVAAATSGDFTTVWSKVDFDSTVTFYVWQELLKSVDGPSHGLRLCRDNSSGIFLGKMFFIGWDYDLSAAGHDATNSPDGFFMKDNWWFKRLLLDPNFVAAVKVKFVEVEKLIFDNISTIQKNFDYVAATGATARNFTKWGVISNPYETINVDSSPTSAVTRMIQWYKDRMAYLRSQWEPAQNLTDAIDITVHPSADLDPAATFISAASITDATQQSAITTLVSDLKTAGLWNKFIAVYPMVGGTASKHKFNLKDPRDLDSAYRLTFNGGLTHSSTGIKPDGSSGYADTHIYASTALTRDDVALSYYSREDLADTTPSGGAVMMGLAANLNYDDALYMFARLGTANSGLWGGRINSSSEPNDTYNPTVNNAAGFMVGSRSSSSSANLYRNGTAQLGTASTWPSAPMAPGNVTLFAINNLQSGVVSFELKECAFASLGTSMTPTQIADFYSIVQTFQTTLGRQV